jgi:hypothetical protein
MHLLLSFALLSPAVHAGPFTHRSSQGAWVERQVEREFTMPKGWLQLELAADSKGSHGSRDNTGAIVPHDDGTAWQYSRLWLNIHQGFGQRVSIYAQIPVVHAYLKSASGASTGTLAMGDVHTGFWFQPWRDNAWALALQGDLKAPSGVEWPGDFIGGSANTSGFLTGTGITNVGAHLHLRRTLGSAAALRARVGYVRKFPSVVGYIIEDDGFGNGWLDAGDEFLGGLEAQVQIADAWAVTGGATYSHRGVYRMGVSGEGAASLDLSSIPNSAGDFVDAGLSLDFSPSTWVELGLGAQAQVLGSDTRLFSHLGLEEFSPQPGLVLDLRGAVRW